MTTWGLDSAAGYVAPRTADELAELKAAIDARMIAAGLPAMDWEYDQVATILVEAVSAQLGSLGEATQAIYDAQIPSGATGIHLDDLGALRGVTRRAATYSTTTATLTGTSGTIVPTGKVCRDSSGARWVLAEDGTVGSTVALRAEETGPTTLASSQTLTPITPVSGWTGGTTTVAATPGRDHESDATYRTRQERALANRGSLSPAALQGRLLELSFITAALVVTNPTAAAVTTGGLTLAANSFTVVIAPSTITTAQKETVAETIYSYAPPGIYQNGSASATVTREDGYSETIRWSYASTLAVTVVATVTLKSGYVLADVQSGIEDLIADWFTDNAALGVAITDSQIEAAIMNATPGVARVVVTLNAGTTVTPTLAQIPALGTATVTT